MQATIPLEHPVPGALERRSTRVAFFVAGFGMAAWAPLVPYARDRLGVDEGTLGLLLLCLGAGSILTMVPAGTLAARFGCRAVILASSAVLCAALPLLALASSVPALAVALMMFGAGLGTVDVVMNIQAVLVEKSADRPLMSGFHGLFSVGGIAGAGGVSLVLWAGASPLAATLCVVALTLCLLAAFGRHLLPYGSEGDGPAFVTPRGAVLLIGALAFILFLTEGAILDWSAVFLTSIRGVPPSEAGWGYAVFALTMTLGRLTGDRIVQALGGRMILITGSLCAGSGLVLAALVPSPTASLLGFALVGLGASNVVPVLFSATGRQTAMPPNLAIAAMTTIGYAGILAGPALIGFVAEATSLRIAFLMLAAMLLVVAANARIAGR